MNKDELNVRKLTGPMPKGKKQEDGSYLFEVCGAEFVVYKYQHRGTIWSWEPCGSQFVLFFGDYDEFKTKKAAIEHLEKRLRQGFYVSKEIPENMNLTHYALIQKENDLVKELEEVGIKIEEYEK